MMPRKNFLQFHAIFALGILTNTVTGIMMMQNIFFGRVVSRIHIVSGVVIFSVLFLLLATKKGRSATKVISNMTRPSLRDLKNRNLLFFSFKTINLLFASLVVIQLISGLILSTGFFDWPFIYTLHRLVTPVLIITLVTHVILATSFRRTVNNRIKSAKTTTVS
jgi:hypothetical protein